MLSEQNPLQLLLQTNVETIAQKYGLDNIFSIELDWNEVNKLNVFQKRAETIRESLGGWPELIILSDCIFQDVYGDSWKQLVKILAFFKNCNADVIIYNSVERRNQTNSSDGVAEFITLLKENNVSSRLIKTIDATETSGTVEIYQHIRSR